MKWITFRRFVVSGMIFSFQGGTPLLAPATEKKRTSTQKTLIPADNAYREAVTFMANINEVVKLFGKRDSETLQKITQITQPLQATAQTLLGIEMLVKDIQASIISAKLIPHMITCMQLSTEQARKNYTTSHGTKICPAAGCASTRSACLKRAIKRLREILKPLIHDLFVGYTLSREDVILSSTKKPGLLFTMLDIVKEEELKGKLKQLSNALQQVDEILAIVEKSITQDFDAPLKPVTTRAQPYIDEEREVQHLLPPQVQEIAEDMAAIGFILEAIAGSSKHQKQQDVTEENQRDKGTKHPKTALLAGTLKGLSQMITTIDTFASQLDIMNKKGKLLLEQAQCLKYTTSSCKKKGCTNKESCIATMLITIKEILQPLVDTLIGKVKTTKTGPQFTRGFMLNALNLPIIKDSDTAMDLNAKLQSFGIGLYSIFNLFDTLASDLQAHAKKKAATTSKKAFQQPLKKKKPVLAELAEEAELEIY